jgi:hypothetical protein
MVGMNHDLGAGSLDRVGDVEVGVANKSVRVEREQVRRGGVPTVLEVQQYVLTERVHAVGVGGPLHELDHGAHLVGREPAEVLDPDLSHDVTLAASRCSQSCRAPGPKPFTAAVQFVVKGSQTRMVSLSGRGCTGGVTNL